MPCRVKHRVVSAKVNCRECQKDAAARLGRSTFSSPSSTRTVTDIDINDAPFTQDGNWLLRAAKAQQSDPLLREAIAGNPNTPLAGLEAMEESEYKNQVIEAIAKNRNADDRLLLRIAGRSSRYEYSALSNPSLSLAAAEQILTSRSSPITQRRIIYREKRMPPEMIDRLARDEWDDGVHDSIVGSTHTPIDTVAYIVSVTKSPRAFQSAAKRADITEEVASIVERRASGVDRQSLLFNPAVTNKMPSVLDAMARGGGDASVMASSLCVNFAADKYGVSYEAAEYLVQGSGWWELEDDSHELFIARTMHQSEES